MQVLDTNLNLHNQISGSPALALAPENFSNPKPQQKSSNQRHLLEHIHNFTNHKLANPILAAGNFISGATDFIDLPSPLKKIIDKSTFLSTKAMMMLRYAETGLAALEKNRIIETIGRLVGLVSLPLVELHDLTLASGLAEFIPQIDLSLEGKLGKEKEYANYNENLHEWKDAFFKQVKEVFTGGFGKNRKILPIGKDRGHTLTLAGILTFLGAGIGVGFGRKTRNLWNKVGGTIRTLGSMMADYTLLTHPDRKMNHAGIFFIVAGVTDFIQRFMPADKYLNTINRFNIVNTMIGGHIITNRTHQKNRNQLEVYNR